MKSSPKLHRRILEARTTVCVRSRFATLYAELIDEEPLKKTDIGWLTQVRVAPSPERDAVDRGRPSSTTIEQEFSSESDSASAVVPAARAAGGPPTSSNGDLESCCGSDADTDVQDPSPCIQAITATDDAEAKGKAKVVTHQQTGANPSATQSTIGYINFVAPVDNKCAVPEEKIRLIKYEQPVTRPNAQGESSRASRDENDAHMNWDSLETGGESSHVQAAIRKRKCSPEVHGDTRAPHAEAPLPPANPQSPSPPTPPKVRKRPRVAGTANTNATTSTANPCLLPLRRADDGTPVRSSPRFRLSPSPHPSGGGLVAKPDSGAFDGTEASAPDNSMDTRTPRCARERSGTRASSQDLTGKQPEDTCVKEPSDIHSRPPSYQGVEKTRIGPRLMRARLERERRRAAAAASAGSPSLIASQAVNKRIVHVESLSDRPEQKASPGEGSGDDNDDKGTQGTLERNGHLGHQCKDDEAGSLLGSNANPRGYRGKRIAEGDRDLEHGEKAGIDLENSADGIKSRPKASCLNRNAQCEQRRLPRGPGLTNGSSHQTDEDLSYSNDVRSPAPSRNSNSLPGRKRLRDASDGPGNQLAGAYDDGGDRLLEPYKDQGTGGDELHKKQQADDESEKKYTHVLIAKERVVRPIASWFPKRRSSEQAGHQEVRGKHGPTVEPCPSLDREDSLPLSGAKTSTVTGHDWVGVRPSWSSSVNDGGTCRSPGVVHPNRPVANTRVMKSTSYWTGSSASPLGTTTLTTSSATPNNSLSVDRREGRRWRANEELREKSTFVHATSPQGVDDHYGVTYSAQERMLPSKISDPSRATTSEGAVDSASRSTRTEASGRLSESPSLRHAPLPGDDAQVFSGRGQWARSGVFIPTCPMVVWWEEDIVNREQYFGGGGGATRTKYSYGWGPVMMNVPADEVAGDFARPMESPDSIHRQDRGRFASGFGGADGELISPPPRFLGSGPARF